VEKGDVMFPKTEIEKLYKTLPKSEIEKIYKDYKAEYEQLKDSNNPRNIGKLIVVAWMLQLLEELLNDKKKVI